MRNGGGGKIRKRLLNLRRSFTRLKSLKYHKYVVSIGGSDLLGGAVCDLLISDYANCISVNGGMKKSFTFLLPSLEKPNWAALHVQRGPKD